MPSPTIDSQLLPTPTRAMASLAKAAVNYPRQGPIAYLTSQRNAAGVKQGIAMFGAAAMFSLLVWTGIKHQDKLTENFIPLASVSFLGATLSAQAYEMMRKRRAAETLLAIVANSETMRAKDPNAPFLVQNLEGVLDSYNASVAAKTSADLQKKQAKLSV